MPRFNFRGVLGFENQPTGDGRLIETGALSWGTNPMPLGFVASSSHGHAGASTVAQITSLERQDDGAIYAEGHFADTDMVPDAHLAAYLAAGGFAPGVSFDLSRASIELRIKEDVFNYIFGDGDRPESWATSDEPDEHGMVHLASMAWDEEMMVFTEAEVRGATLVSIPAFRDTWIEVLSEDGEVLSGEDIAAGDTALVASGQSILSSMSNEMAPSVRIVSDDQEQDSDSDAPALTASGVPPATISTAAFDNPSFPGPMPITVSPDGRVFGHLATWDECHTGLPGTCVSPPSGDDFSRFHLSPVTVTDPETGDTSTIRVGRLSYGGGHADPKYGPVPTVAHYDNVASTVAFVRAGEDEHGIWISGVLADGVPDATLRGFQSAPISGDWRRIGGSLMLHAICSVNTPGFARSYINASGQQMSLVAAGTRAAPIFQSDPAIIDVPGLAAALAAEMRAHAEAERLEAEMLLSELEDLLAE